MQQLEAIFSGQGLLASRVPGYQPRTSQLELAEAIRDAVKERRHLLVEAGTGTGKTLAYLVPAILSGQKVIISTGTKNLQDQLFNKDLPIIRETLSVPFKAALLKGRGNYLCRYRLNAAIEIGASYSRQQASELAEIRDWSGRTRNGDIAEVASIPETSAVWHQVTSTGDNCLGQECPAYSDCHLVKARRRAQGSEVVVVNDHLLCADWSIKEGGFGELLPDAELIIIDEAHQLPDTASKFFGTSVSGRQLNELANDVIAEHLQEAPDMPTLADGASDLQQKIREFRLALRESSRRGSWREIVGKKTVTAALENLSDQLEELFLLLKPAEVRGKGLESCYRRCGEMMDRMRCFDDNDGDSDWVRWFETFPRGFILTRTPLEVAEQFQRIMSDHKATWIFTSATLTVAQSFEHIKSTLGMPDALALRWDSPFDYASQTLFYHPRDMPDPASADFVPALVDTALPVLKASQGRAFMLFSSHRALRHAAQLLQDRLDYPLFVQGSQSKQSLLEQFRSEKNAILMGAASFWEGVDVKGEALSCVIIDKLPFASPADPVVKARLDAFSRRGQNPFQVYQIPNAVIALKQGIGRLIRGADERGVLMVCDPRLLKRSYGRVFLDSIPPMARTRAIDDVEAFFAAEPARQSA